MPSPEDPGDGPGITIFLAALTLTATASPASLPEPGGTATISVSVDNTSTNPATLTSLDDDVLGDLDGEGSCATGVTIASNDTYSCSYGVSVAGDAGDVISRVVSALLTDQLDATTADGTDVASVTITDVASSMTLTKTASPTTLAEPGGNVTFSVVIDNTSAADAITVDSLVDDPYGDLDGQGTCVVPQTIPAGGQYTCAFMRALTGDPGDVLTDTVTADATDDDGAALSESDDASVTIADVPSSMTLTKTASPTTLPESSGDVTFTVVIDNTSPVDVVTIDSLVDDQHGDLDGQGTCDVPQTIAVGGTYACSFTATLSGNAGQVVTDTITGSGTDDDGLAVSADDSASVTFTDVLPSMTVSKSPVPATLPEPGGTVDFTIVVTNTSSEPITLSSLVDNQFGNLDGQGTCAVPQVIPEGGAYTCVLPGDVFGDAGDAHVNRVTAVARDDEGHNISAQDDASVTLTDIVPFITLDKQVTPEELPEPGGQVQIRVEITNPSTEDVVVTALTDSIHGSLSGQGTCVLPTTVRARGGTYVCSLNVTVAGEPGYSETDTVTATAQDNEGNPVTAADDATVTIVDVLPAISVDKQTVPSSLPEPGGSYDVVVTVRNDSPVDDLLVTSIVDVPHGDLNGQGTCVVPQTIAPGASYTCRLPEGLIGNAGASETDTVTVTGQDNEGNVVSDSDTATFTVTDLIPQITVDKSASPASVPEPGGPVTFTVSVTNDSPEQVTQITLGDDVFGDLNGQGSCATPIVLAPAGEAGDTYTCSFTRFITGDAGEAQVDIVTATGQDDEGNVVEGSDRATVTITDELPEFQVSKTIRPTTLPEPGGTVAITVRVENAGAEPVVITELVDDPYGDLDGVGGCSVPQTIEPDEAYACTFLQSVSGNANEVLTDTLTATGSDNEGNEISDSADASATITDVPPSLVVDKSANPSSVAPPGGDVSFAITVRNLSVIEDLVLTSLVDAPYGDVTDPANPQLIGSSCVVPQTIVPGGTYDCAFRVFVPWTAGGSTDVVTATGQDDDGGTATDTDGATVGPGVAGQTMTKTASPRSMPEPGGIVTYTVTVDNDSAAPFQVLSIIDDPYGDVTDTSNPRLVATTCAVPRTVAVGADYVCTFQVDVAGEPGQYRDEVTVVTSGGTLTDDATVTLTDALPGATLSKTADPLTVTEPGGLVTFDVAIVNESPADVLDLTLLVDDVRGDITDASNPALVSTTCAVPQAIDVGDTYQCSFTALVRGSAGDTEVDFVLAGARDNERNPVYVFDTATVTVTDAPPDFRVTKTPSRTTIPEPGGTVTFTVRVLNDAPEPVRITSLVDDQGGVTLDLDGQGSCLVPQTIPAGGTYVCSFQRPVTGDTGDVVADTVTATGVDDDGNSLDQTADAQVLITNVAPSLRVVKSGAPNPVPEPGGPVTYTVTITNTSMATDPVTIQTLTDSVDGGPATTPPDLACQVVGSPVAVPFDLQPGDAATCTFGGTVTGDAGASTSDTFTATGVDDEGTPMTASGSTTIRVSDVLPTMTVLKTASPNPIPEPGGLVTFTVSVTNTSPEAIFITNVHDDVAGTLSPARCPLPNGGRVEAGATYQCSWTGIVLGDVGDVRSNIVTVIAHDNEGNVIGVSDQEDTVISDVLPTVNLTKTANPATMPEPGGNVTFTVRVVNTTPEPIVILAAMDDVYGPLDTLGTCAGITRTLLPGQGYVCTFVGAVTGTAAASPYTDTVTLGVRDNDGNVVTPQASASVTLTDVAPTIDVTKDAAPATRPEPGGVFTFPITVRNTSTVDTVVLTTLVDVPYGNIADPGNPAIVSTTCALVPPVALVPGGSYSCSFQAAFTGNANAAQTDTVTATAVDDEGTTATDTDTATVRLTNVRPVIGATKVPNPATLPEPGGPVTFSVTIDNLSTVDPVVLTALTDDVYGNLNGQGTCAVPQTLPIGGSYSCSFTGPVIGTAASSPYRDTITGTARDDDGTTVRASAFADVGLTDVLPAITVDKTATPLTLPEPSGDFTFSIRVTNTSVEPVVLLTLADDVYGSITSVHGNVVSTTCTVTRTIAVGATYTCSFVGRFTGNAGDVQTDVVTATARDDENNRVTDTDDATVELTDALPAITVDKTASPLVMDEPGGDFTFGVTVTNTSVEPVTLTSLVDDVYGDLDGRGGCAVPQAIAVGASYACSFVGEFTGNDGDSQTDVVTAAAEDDEGNEATDDDDATVTLTDVLPGITVDKTAIPLTLPEPGGDFTFGVTVTNGSVEPLTLTSLVDDVYGDLDGQGDCAVPQAMAIGESYSCAFTGAFTGNAGDTQTDTITAVAEDDEGNAATDAGDATVTLTDVPSSIEVTKAADPVEVDEPGATVTFSITVHNTSPVDTVVIDSLSDDVHGDLDGQGDCAVPQTLAPDASYACSFTADVLGNAGYVETDTVTASGTDDDGAPVSDDDDATVTVVDVRPGITVDKTAAPLTRPEPGGDVTFSVSVTNDSVESLTLVGLVDDVYGDLDGQGDCAVPQAIAIGASYSCSFTGAFTGNAGDTQTDTVTATAQDDEGNEATDTDDATVTLTDVLPVIRVDKTADPLALPEPGGPVTFGVTVTNDSTVEAVTLTGLTDDVYGDITRTAGDIVSTTCALPRTIGIGAAYSCEFVAPVEGSAADSPFTDTVTAIAEDDEGNEATDADDASVELTDVLPAITVAKSADPETMPEPGGQFTFRVAVTNDSVEPVTLTSLVDDVYGDLDGQGDCELPRRIAAGERYRCSFPGALTGNAGDTQTDVVTALATDDEGNQATDDDDATVVLDPVPAVISMTKTPDRTTVVAPGGTVTFRVTVTNESTFEAVTLDSMVDSVFGDLDGQGTCVANGSVTIEPGGTYRCRFTGEVSGRPGTKHTNRITAMARDDDAPAPEVVRARARAVVRVIAPDIPLPPTDTAP